jgi:sporulation protein YlmC with PRC-barrel domain
MNTRVVSAMVVAVCAGAAVGQVLSQPRDRWENTRTPDVWQPQDRDEVVGLRTGTLMPVDWAVGSRVLGTNQERLGELSDVILDARRGRVVYGLLEHGGMLGLGQEYVPVPWNNFTWDAQSRVLSVGLTKERLESAPRIDRDDWRRLGDAEWRQRFEQFFDGAEDGQATDRWSRLVREGREVTVRGTVRDLVSLEPVAGLGAQRGLRIETNDGQERVVLIGPAWFVDQQRDMIQRGQQVQVNASTVSADNNRTFLVAKDVRTARGTYKLRDDDGRAPWQLRVDGDERLDRDDDRWRDTDRRRDTDRWRDADRWREDDRQQGTLVRARDLRGQRLMDAQNNELGRVQSVVFSPEDGKVGFAVLSTGGIMGMAESSYAVPWNYFDVDQQGRIATTRLERTMLENAPKLETRNWSELSDPRFEQRVRQHFGADRGFDRGNDDWRRDQDRRDQGRRDDAWRSNPGQGQERSTEATELQRKFATGASTTFEGSIVGIDRTGGNGVVDLVLRTDEGERVVKLVPANRLDTMGLTLRQGETVRIRGKHADHDGKRIIIAQDITMNGRRFELRDRNGYVSDER